MDLQNYSAEIEETQDDSSMEDPNENGYTSKWDSPERPLQAEISVVPAETAAEASAGRTAGNDSALKSEGFQLDFSTVCMIQPLLDLFKSKPLVGLEYLVEIKVIEKNICSFRCVLCSTTLLRRDLVLKHMTCLNHKLRYVWCHFQKFHFALGSHPRREQIVDKLWCAIESNYGRKRPVQCSQDDWRDYKTQICEAVLKREHISEMMGKTFVEIALLPLDIEERLDDSTIDDHTNDANQEDNDNDTFSHGSEEEENLSDKAVEATSSKTALVTASGQDEFQLDFNAVCQIQAHIDTRPSLTLIGLEYLVEIVQKEKHKRPRYRCLMCSVLIMTSIHRGVVDHFTGKHHRTLYLVLHFQTLHMEVMNSECSETQTLYTICRFIERKFGRLRPVQCSQSHFDLHSAAISRAVVDRKHFSGSNLKETLAEIFESAKSDDYVTSKGRNIDAAPQANKEDLSPQLLAAKNMHQISNLIRYKKKVKEESDESLELLDYHVKNPEKHPQYCHELSKFAETKNIGEVKTDQFKSDWTVFWAKRMMELHEEKLEEKKKELRQQLDFPVDKSPTRDMVVTQSSDKNKTLRQPTSPKQRSCSSAQKSRPSISGRRSRSPARRRDPRSPKSRRSRSPAGRRHPSSPRRRSRSSATRSRPIYASRRSRSPAEKIRPSSPRRRSRSPAGRRHPTSPGRRSRSPAPRSRPIYRSRRSRSPAEKIRPSSPRRRSRSPAGRRHPKSPGRRSRSPAPRSRPILARRRSRSPAGKICPSSARKRRPSLPGRRSQSPAPRSRSSSAGEQSYSPTEERRSSSPEHQYGLNADNRRQADRTCDNEKRCLSKSREDNRSRKRSRDQVQSSKVQHVIEKSKHTEKVRSRISRTPDKLASHTRGSQIQSSDEEISPLSMADEDSDNDATPKKKKEAVSSPAVPELVLNQPAYYTSQKQMQVNKVKEASQDGSTLAEYLKNTEKHPLYNKEWHKFWTRRCKEIRAANKDPATYDLKPEWIVFWTKRMIELYEMKLESNKKNLKEQFDFSLDVSPSSDPFHLSDSEHDVTPQKKKEAESSSVAATSQPAHDSHKQAQTQHKSKLAHYSKHPREHPLHDIEYKKFKARHYELMKAANVDTANHNLKTKWDKYWQKRMVELYNKTRKQIFSTRDPSTNVTSNEEITRHPSAGRKSPSQKKTVRQLSKPTVEKYSDDESDRVLHVKSRGVRPVQSNEDITMISLMSDGDSEHSDEVSSDNCKESEPGVSSGSKGPSHPPVTAVPWDILKVLRQLVALEDYLGPSLGPSILKLLGEVLRMEKQKPKSSENIMDTDEHIMLLEMVKQKLQGKVEVGLLGSATQAVREVIARTTALLQLVQTRKEDKRKEEEQEAEKRAAAVDKELVKQQVATSLGAKGNTDMTKQELATLVDTLIDKAQAKRRVNTQRPVTSIGFPKKNESYDSLKEPKMSTLEMIQGPYKERNRKTEKDKPPSASPSHSPSPPYSPTQSFSPLPLHSPTLCAMDAVSDLELQEMMREMEQLEDEDEEEGRADYEQMLEVQNPRSVLNTRNYRSDEMPTAPPPLNMADLSTKIATHSQAAKNPARSQRDEDAYNAHEKVSILLARKMKNYIKQKEMEEFEKHNHQSKPKPDVELEKTQLYKRYTTAKQVDSYQLLTSQNVGGQGLYKTSPMQPGISETETQARGVVEHLPDYHEVAQNSNQKAGFSVTDSAKWAKLQTERDDIQPGHSKDYGNIQDSNYQDREGRYHPKNHSKQQPDSEMRDSQEYISLKGVSPRNESSQKDKKMQQSNFWQLFSKAKYQFSEKHQKPQSQ